MRPKRLSLPIGTDDYTGWIPLSRYQEKITAAAFPGSGGTITSTLEYTWDDVFAVGFVAANANIQEDDTWSAVSGATNGFVQGHPTAVRLKYTTATAAGTFVLTTGG